MKISKSMVKSVGMAILGAGVTLLSGWIDNEKLDDKIDRKVNEALANMIQKDKP